MTYKSVLLLIVLGLSNSVIVPMSTYTNRVWSWKTRAGIDIDFLYFFANYLVNWWPGSGPWDLVFRLGCNSPFIEGIDGMVESDVFLPYDCAMVQGHMVGPESI